MSSFLQKPYFIWILVGACVISAIITGYFSHKNSTNYETCTIPEDIGSEEDCLNFFSLSCDKNTTAIEVGIQAEELEITLNCSYGSATNAFSFIAVAAVIINGICIIFLQKKVKIALYVSIVCLFFCIIATLCMFVQSLFNSTADDSECTDIWNESKEVFFCSRSRYIVGAFFSILSVLVCGVSIIYQSVKMKNSGNEGNGSGQSVEA